VKVWSGGIAAALVATGGTTEEADVIIEGITKEADVANVGRTKPAEVFAVAVGQAKHPMS